MRWRRCRPTSSTTGATFATLPSPSLRAPGALHSCAYRCAAEARTLGANGARCGPAKTLRAPTCHVCSAHSARSCLQAFRLVRRRHHDGVLAQVRAACRGAAPRVHVGPAAACLRAPSLRFGALQRAPQALTPLAFRLRPVGPCRARPCWLRSALSPGTRRRLLGTSRRPFRLLTRASRTPAAVRRTRQR